MEMPVWWGERRFGLCIDGGVASVPAWAPIGASAGDYWQLLRGPAHDLAPGDPAHLDGPLVEVLAHHRDRWGHIEHYDDFVPLLTFGEFDPADWTRLVVDAGMGYSTLVADHRDGWCWWDAPACDRSLADTGPRRNVVSEYAAACRERGIVVGAHLVADGPSSIARANDLVDRYGVELLCGDRIDRIGSGTDSTRALGRPEPAPERLDRAVLVDQAWHRVPGEQAGAGASGRITTFDLMPQGVLAEPWQLWRPLGASCSHNRAEPSSARLDADGVVAVLTEVVAKGGNLLLGVGPDAEGSIPDEVRRPLLGAGRWLGEHAGLIDRARPWTTWGDDHVRYVVVDDVLHAIDLSGRGSFAALPDGAPLVVEGVVPLGAQPAEGVEFHQDRGGLHVDDRTTARRSSDPTPAARVYRIAVREREQAIELFEPGDTLDQTVTVPLAELLTDATDGTIVQLGEATYAGPASVPDGVTLRGLGTDRTSIVADGGPITLGRGARLEHTTVDAPAAATALTVAGRDATVLGCAVLGTLAIDADGAVVRACELTAVRTAAIDRFTLSHCGLTAPGIATAVEIAGGGGHVIESNEFGGHPCAIHISDAVDVAVRANHIEARWWAVRLQRTDRAHVHGNLVIATMRAVDVDGGADAIVDGNAIFDGDSGCLLQRGAVGCEVSGNHWERCRIGLLTWDVDDAVQRDNSAVGLTDPDGALVTGP